MKSAIVKMSTLMKYDNWSPSFYLRPATELETAKRREEAAKKMLESAAALRKLRRKEQAKIRRMVKDGEVIPLG
jgi:hypothetical protein